MGLSVPYLLISWASSSFYSWEHLGSFIFLADSCSWDGCKSLPSDFSAFVQNFFSNIFFSTFTRFSHSMQSFSFPSSNQTTCFGLISVASVALSSMLDYCKNRRMRQTWKLLLSIVHWPVIYSSYLHTEESNCQILNNIKFIHIAILQTHIHTYIGCVFILMMYTSFFHII